MLNISATHTTLNIDITDSAGESSSKKNIKIQETIKVYTKKTGKKIPKLSINLEKNNKLDDLNISSNYVDIDMPDSFNQKFLQLEKKLIYLININKKIIAKQHTGLQLNYAKYAQDYEQLMWSDNPYMHKENKKQIAQLIKPKEGICLTNNLIHDYYNAHCIDFNKDTDSYIAAEGPQKNNQNIFISMLNKAQSYVSVSLVASSELEYVYKNSKLTIAPNKRLDITINSKHLDTTTVSVFYCASYEVTPDLSIEVLLINDKFHIRAYDTNWQDHDSDNIIKQLAATMFYENLNKLVMSINSAEKRPLTINCSAGLGRTGTLISIFHMRNLKQSNKLSDNSVDDIIQKIRSIRAGSISSVKQYTMLRSVFDMLNDDNIEYLDLLHNFNLHVDTI